jgi:hypothetical protein
VRMPVARAVSPVVRDVVFPELTPYSPAEDREAVRSWLAFLLIGLVVVEIVGFGVMGFVIVRNPASAAQIDGVKELIGLLLTPSIALASAVMGFYYATKDQTS